MVNAVSEIIQCRLIRRVEFQVFDLKFPVLAWKHIHALNGIGNSYGINELKFSITKYA